MLAFNSAITGTGRGVGVPNCGLEYGKSGDRLGINGAAQGGRGSLGSTAGGKNDHLVTSQSDTGMASSLTGE